MALSDLFVGIAIGIVLGLVLATLWHLARQARMQEELAYAKADAEQARREVTAKVAAQLEIGEQMRGTFAELAQKVLESNTEGFLSLAKARIEGSEQLIRQLLDQKGEAIATEIQPVKELLEKYQQALQKLEIEREKAYQSLFERAESLQQSTDALGAETRRLVTALRQPTTRGQWGEQQLRRVVEMAGMLEHCDFDTQVSLVGETGTLRPDLVVHMPGGQNIVVDAKVPLEAYLRVVEAEDDGSRSQALAEHARQIRAHIEALSKREYWRHVSPSPEFVVAFIPNDALLAAAFSADGNLFDDAINNHVLLATPATLIALLKAAAYGFRQEVLAENALAVQRLGYELYDRFTRFTQHYAKLGQALGRTVAAYNDSVGSFDRRLLPKAREFANLGGSKGTDRLEAPEQLTVTPRLPASLDQPTAQVAPFETPAVLDQDLSPELE